MQAVFYYRHCAHGFGMLVDDDYGVSGLREMLLLGLGEYVEGVSSCQSSALDVGPY